MSLLLSTKVLIASVLRRLGVDVRGSGEESTSYVVGNGIPGRSIYVVSLPKCGGTSIAVMLRDTFPKRRVYHIHALSRSGLEGFRKSMLESVMGRSNGVEKIVDGHVNIAVEAKGEIRDFELSTGNRGGFYFCGVREPISLAVSHLFQWFDQYAEQGIDLDVESVKKLLIEGEGLLNEPSGFSQSGLSKWIERELEEPLNVEILEKPFNREVGWQLYESEGVCLTIVRQENFGAIRECFAEAFEIPARVFATTSSNRAKDKNYFKAYQNVRSQLKFPKAFLEKVYFESSYVTTFYSRDEIEGFIERWVED